MAEYALENVTLYPLGSLDNNNLIFVFPPEQTSYWCPRYTDIFVRLRVVNGDGSLLIKGQKVYPSPAFACTLFQQLGVFYNETRIGQSSNMLPYVSYLKCLANCTSDVVATYLSRAMLFMTDISPADEKLETNLQAETRGQYIAESKWLTLQWRLDEGFLAETEPLPSGSRLRVELAKTDSTFSLMWPISGADAPSRGNPKIEYSEVHLIAARARPTPSLAATLEARLTNNLHLKYVSTQTSSFIVPKGSHGLRIEDLFHGMVPNRALLTVVRQKSQQGSADLSPFCLSGRLRQVTYVDFHKDGRSLLDKPLTPAFAPYNSDGGEVVIDDPSMLGDYLPSYLNYLRSITVDQVPLANDISYQLYANARTIFGVKPSAQSAAEGGAPILGSFSVELRFGGAGGADDYLTVICLGEFPGEVSVDKQRSVTVVH